jgi:hypothetical protein
MILQNGRVKTNLFFNPDVEQKNALRWIRDICRCYHQQFNPIVTLEQATEALKVAYQIIDCFKNK